MSHPHTGLDRAPRYTFQGSLEVLEEWVAKLTDGEAARALQDLRSHLATSSEAAQTASLPPGQRMVVDGVEWRWGYLRQGFLLAFERYVDSRWCVAQHPPAKVAMAAVAFIQEVSREPMNWMTSEKQNWTATSNQLPMRGQKVEWIAPSGEVCEGIYDHVWLLKGSGMHVYYTPAFWRALEEGQPR